MASNKAYNKKVYNHYIPQFLLRNFSDNGKSISMYIKEKDQLVENASIKKVAGSDYLYGKNGEFEDWFCCYEGEVSSIIKDILIEKKLPKKLNLKEILYSFFTVSEARTKAIGEALENGYSSVVKNDVRYAIMTDNPSFNHFTYEDIEKIKISVDTPNFDLVKSALEIVKHIEDLKMILVINKTTIPFVISDCPVAKYNPFLIDCINVSSYGWCQKGILAFMPISNDSVIGLIDTSIYKLKSLKHDKIHVYSEEQINELNKLFALQAEKFIFSTKNLTKEYVKSLLSKESEAKTLNWEKLLITKFSVKSVRVKINLSFIKMKVQPLKGQYHNKSDIYRKHTISLFYNSQEEYKPDKSVDYNKLFANIEKVLRNKEEII